jgi:arginase family enzyme
MLSNRELLLYFNPVDSLQIISDERMLNPLGSFVQFNRKNSPEPVFDQARIFLAGLGTGETANSIRSYLYGLCTPLAEHDLIDLGNLRDGRTPADTRAGLADVISALLVSGKILILLGENTHLIPILGKAFDRLETAYNLTVVDPRIDAMDNEHAIKSHYLNELIKDPAGKLFDFAHLGYQSYLNDQSLIDRLGDLFFEHHRLGLLRDDLREAEPVFRNSDIAFLSMNSVRQGDAPAALDPSPNGFTAEEICQLARYAGLSDKLSLITLAGMDPRNDLNGQTAALAAQMVWFFLQGVAQRKSDYPFCNISDYIKHKVHLPKTGHDLTFYKSPFSGRWWLEVPYPDTKYPRYLYVACSHRDYLNACEGEIPDRWWNHYRRLS